MRIGVDLGGTKIEIAALGADGQVVFRRRAPTPRGDYEGTVETVRALVADCERDTGPGTVGVAIPGVVSPATGLVKNANSTWLNGRPFAADLERALARPVRLANDANCFALSEAVDGAAAGARIVFGVIVGTGTGGGIVVDRQALLGANAIAGEWGHNPLPWPELDECPGPPCYCGRSGCIETFLSGPALVREFTARRPGSTVAGAAEIDALARGGDPIAVATLERHAERMARALASVINIMDPEVIVLGGGVSNLEGLYARVPELWKPFVFSDEVRTRLVRPRYGDSSGVRGAAWLWQGHSLHERNPWTS